MTREALSITLETAAPSVEIEEPVRVSAGYEPWSIYSCEDESCATVRITKEGNLRIYEEVKLEASRSRALGVDEASRLLQAELDDLGKRSEKLLTMLRQIKDCK